MNKPVYPSVIGHNDSTYPIYQVILRIPWGHVSKAFGTIWKHGVDVNSDESHGCCLHLLMGGRGHWKPRPLGAEAGHCMTFEEDSLWWLSLKKVENRTEGVPLGMERGGVFFLPFGELGLYLLGNQEQEEVVRFIFRVPIGAVRGSIEVGDPQQRDLPELSCPWVQVTALPSHRQPHREEKGTGWGGDSVETQPACRAGFFTNVPTPS